MAARKKARTAAQKAADKKNGERLSRLAKKRAKKAPKSRIKQLKAAHTRAEAGVAHRAAQKVTAAEKKQLAKVKRELKLLERQIEAGKKRHATAHKGPRIGPHAAHHSAFRGVSINDEARAVESGFRPFSQAAFDSSPGQVGKGGKGMPLPMFARRLKLLQLEAAKAETRWGQQVSDVKPYISKGDSPEMVAYLLGE